MVHETWVLEFWKTARLHYSMIQMAGKLNQSHHRVDSCAALVARRVSLLDWAQDWGCLFTLVAHAWELASSCRLPPGLAWRSSCFACWYVGFRAKALHVPVMMVPVGIIFLVEGITVRTSIWKDRSKWKPKNRLSGSDGGNTLILLSTWGVVLESLKATSWATGRHETIDDSYIKSF